MTIPEILEALTTYTGRFPENAVRAAIEQREAIVPELLRVLEATAEAPDAYAQRETYMLHSYALYLLAQFREKRAYLPTLRILSAPGDACDTLFGDTLTERMANLLGSIYDGDPEPLRRLVENESANVWARVAAVHTLIVLVATGQMPREDVARYLGELLAGRLPRTPGFVWDAVADAVGHLPAPELLEAVKRTFDDGLQEDHPSAFHYIAQDAAMSPKKRARLMAEKYGLVENAVDEMSWWAAFDDDAKVLPSRHRDAVPADAGDYDPSPDAGLGALAAHENDSPVDAGTDEARFVGEGQIVRSEPKIGRNDPCPCGSGKKYKKCCLGRSGPAA